MRTVGGSWGHAGTLPLARSSARTPMPKRKPKEASNAAFDGMTSGHPNLLSGSRLTRDRPDLNNSHATQNGVAQGSLFRRRREEARPGVPEASSPKKATRKSGVHGFTVAGQARKKMTPKLTRRSGSPGKKLDGSDRQKRPAQVPKAKKPKGYNEDGSERKKGLKGFNADGSARSARWKSSKGLNKDGSKRKTGSGGRVKGAEGVKTKAARLQERLREEGAQEGSSADHGGDEHGASLSVLA